MTPLTAGNFFSGIGAMDVAFIAAGFDIRWQIENEPFCQRVLKHHRPHYWPESKLHGDIKALSGRDLPPVDVVFGGPPCQPYSKAGRQRGADDNRHLWPQMFRVIQELHPRPRFVLVENVPGLINIFLADLLADLERAAYTPLPPLVIPAAAVGAPHKRDRVWILAYANELGQCGAADTSTGKVALDEGTYRPLCERPGQTEFSPSASGREAVADAAFAGAPAAQQSGWRSLAVESGQTMADAKAGGDRGGGGIVRGETSAPQDDVSAIERGGQTLSNPLGPRLAQRQGFRRHARTQCPTPERGSDRTDGRIATQPGLGTDADGLAGRLAGHRFPAPIGIPPCVFEPPRTAPPDTIPHRKDKVAAIGNAVVPQVVYPLAVSMFEFLKAAAGELA